GATAHTFDNYGTTINHDNNHKIDIRLLSDLEKSTPSNSRATAVFLLVVDVLISPSGRLAVLFTITELSTAPNLGLTALL
ncbi:hypothetical protein BY458DRAFT_565903, partial [Sporodiniella umbellata]